MIRWATFGPRGDYRGSFCTEDWQRPEDAGVQNYPIFRTLVIEGEFDERVHRFIHSFDPADTTPPRVEIDPDKMAAHQAGQIHEWLLEQMKHPEVSARFLLGQASEDDRAALRAALDWKDSQHA